MIAGAPRHFRLLGFSSQPAQITGDWIMARHRVWVASLIAAVLDCIIPRVLFNESGT